MESDDLVRQTVAVVGLGLLGRGIATCFLGHGFKVIGCDHAPNSHSVAESYIERGLREMVAHGRACDAALTNWRDCYQATSSYDNWPKCDFVVESINEDLQEKQAAFAQIEAFIDSTVPIASNTSAIPITELQAGRKHPERFVGLHWFEPAYATRFAELIPGASTSEGTIAKAAAIARQCGKDPSVLSKDIPGFIVNRLGYALYREALYLLEQGIADAETIDRSFRNAIGVWSTIFGPFEWIDLTGGPTLYAKAMKRVLPTLSNTVDLPAEMCRLVQENAHGVANGRGFYSYTATAGKQLDEAFHAHVWRAFQAESDMSNKSK